MKRWIVPSDLDSARTIRLALRWMLILATALLLVPPGSGRHPQAFDTLLILAFACSNVALTLLPGVNVRSRNLEYLIVISDTFLVSLALFRAGLEQAHLPLVFFLTLLFAALGPDLPRMIAGLTALALFYLVLTWRGVSGSPEALAAFLMRLPFLYVVGLYYGQLVQQARREQAGAWRVETEKRELETFLEVTKAATSTLDLHEVLYVIVSRIASLVEALRCSILTVNESAGTCTVLASSDDPRVSGLTIELRKYPEVCRAIKTHRPVVINDVSSDPMLEEVRDNLERLGFQSILVLPLVFGDSLLGMLFLRAARPQGRFSPAEIDACQVVANASANALRNAMLYEEMRTEARRRKESADKLQNILAHFPDLIYATDLEGRLTEYSRGGEALLGHNRDQALGMNFADFYPETATRERLQEMLISGAPVQNLETTVKRRDGTLQEVMVAAAPLRDEAGRLYGTVGIIKNVTDLKMAQRHLLQAEKLGAIGEVVSGVAHELNNPLAGVLGYAQLLMGGPMDARQQRSVERIFESALRCQKIVQNLLAFARQHPAEKRYLGLNGIIEKTLDLKAYQLRVNNIKIVRDLDAALPKTMLDFNQIQQVLLNVINNAQYSMSTHRGQGTLTVRTSAHGGTIRVELADEGPGIARDVLGRIFDPFFTTKPVGEGTGLGLAVSYGIINAHGGRIWADSMPGSGTQILIEIPVRPQEGSAPATPEISPQEVRPHGRSLHILAIDDESVLLDLLVDALGGEGHRVDTAGSAREALQKLERGGYDILVCDLKMPEMDGRQLYEILQARWPEMARRLIFASGDTIHPDTRRFIEHSGRPCIDKPFKLETLSGVIARLASDLERDGQATARSKIG